jgi:hypothetical protein
MAVSLSAMTSMRPASTPSSAVATTSAGSFLGMSNEATMSVSVLDRCRPVTVVPCAASSRRMELVRPHWADLAAP